jgi:tetratricopeptide (TPR) repeat protein
MLFPWALRLGWINWWILSIMALFISSISWSRVLLNRTKNSVLASEINVYAENNCNEEIIDVIAIDELIDLGFKEKHAENLEKAASYFSRALSQDPIPDLAFSLIIDCYWIWSNLGERDYALTQLQTYVQKYLPLFNTELRIQFDTWMVKEDFQMNKIINGGLDYL